LLNKVHGRCRGIGHVNREAISVQHGKEIIMRHLLLASTAAVLLCGGLAFAKGSTTTTVTTIPVVGNAGAALGASAAASGGTSQNASDNTVASDNTTTPTDKNAVSESDSAAATTGGEATNDSDDTLVSVGDVSLSSTRTSNHLDVSAEASNDGDVSDIYVTANAGGKKGGGDAWVNSDASMSNSVNGDAGIITAQQNSGTGALQQNSVALSSFVGGNGGGITGVSP
jgi:hypothetical protein